MQNNHIIDKNFFPGWTRKSVTFSIDDGNFNGSHISLYLIKEKQAENAVTTGNFDEAIQYLEQAKKHAIEYDRVREKQKGKFTCLLLDSCEDDYTGSRTSHPLVDSWKREMTENEIFAVLREREDFQSLMKKSSFAEKTV